MNQNEFLDKVFLEKCINALEKAYQLYEISEIDSVEKDIYRSACVKEFEIILEQTAKIVKKILKNFVVSYEEVNRLYFKDVFRKAAHYELLELEEIQRWLEYRDYRNQTAHEYGSGFAQEVMVVIEQFIKDAKKIVQLIDNHNHAD